MVAFTDRILGRIVHNEAMKSDPKEIYNWRVLLLACSACFGAMSFGWDSSVIGGVINLDPFIHDYGLGDSKSVATANLQGNIVSVLQAGCFVGALAAFVLTDKFGRKWCLVGAAVLTLVGVIMQAAGSGHLEPMYIGRFIAGLGVGCSSVVNPIYISENAPRAIRGLLTGLYQLFIVTGGMIAFWINYAVSIHMKGQTMYIFPLAIQGLPALLLFILMIFSNESPRYLAKSDRWEQAKSVLQRVRQLPYSHPYLQEEIQEIADQLEFERRLIGDASLLNLLKEMWTVQSNRKRAILSIVLMICQQMTGTNAINTYAPTIFKNLGITGTSTSLFSTGVYGIVKTVSCTCFLLFMADSLGRRRSLLVSSVGQAVCMFYIGLYVRIAPPVEGNPVPPAGYVALVCIFIFAAFFQFGWGPACWIYVSEIPTARLRPLNVALAAATQWLFNFVVSRAVPNMIVTVGAHGYGTYLIFGSFCVSMFFFVWFFIPETKGISLEHMDELFGVSEAEKAAVLDRDGKDNYMANIEIVEHTGAHNGHNKV
ncbi:general substrate transporter [Pseudomassariella vexata]|uniref:General substrate transporter n=1 Tax=Pseudomassariella vexata TaxID=1141098 RepID=A0A1Y2D9J6_9PEZI|nr:general substrate transporter [Pseudomassariella vexata]ORY55931.1 general substrate transporter [Pseudomassariella vexata]